MPRHRSAAFPWAIGDSGVVAFLYESHCNRTQTMRLAKAMTIEPATGKDTQAIVSIFIANNRDPGLFQESETRVRGKLQDCLVARNPIGGVVACAGLHRDSDQLAEIYGLASLTRTSRSGNRCSTYAEGQRASGRKAGDTSLVSDH